jgi:two-component system sensor histidine kinase KdpD
MFLVNLGIFAKAWVARASAHPRGATGDTDPSDVLASLPFAPDRTPLDAAVLASLSHDLRTPLACILGSATALDDYGVVLDREARSDLVRVIREEAERLNRFVGNLMDMTRLEAGAIAPRLRAVDLASLVADVRARAARILIGHTIVLQVPPRLARPCVDPILFEQVLFNILENAAKYSAPGSEIRIRAWWDDARVRLSVSDEGPGVPAADVERVFDRFYRVRPLGCYRAGTGLGLAVCQGFVEAMGGSITASNRKDRSGAVFTVVLPIASDDTPADSRWGRGRD